MFVPLQAQDLKLSAAEAARSREDAEIKCQHKIADMVALMEKHKVRILSDLVRITQNISLTGRFRNV